MSRIFVRCAEFGVPAFQISIGGSTVTITFKRSREEDVQEGATIVGNVGNVVGNTVGNVGNTVGNVGNTVGNVIEKDLDINDPKRRKPDIALAKELLGWEPKVALKEGLARTIEYFRGRGRFLAAKGVVEAENRLKT